MAGRSESGSSQGSARQSLDLGYGMCRDRLPTLTTFDDLARPSHPPFGQVVQHWGFLYKSGEMIVPTDLSLPDYPERDPQQLRILWLEQSLRRAADFFRVIGSETMAKECEEALQSRPAPINRVTSN